MNLWWGYLHINGSVQAKRYFAQIDLDEGEQSPFVELVEGPFEAENREEALNILNGVFKTWKDLKYGYEVKWILI